LPPSIGMTAQEHAARGLSSQGCNCRAEPLLVAFRTAGPGRPVWSQLAKGEITAKDGHPRGGERIRERHEKRRVTVRSRTVRQDEAIFTRTDGAMQEPSNRYVIRRSIPILLTVVHTRGPMQTILEVL
jgi:hypothetical protein